MILLKEDALKEQKLADVTDKDQGEVTPVYADAVRQMKKTDKMRQEARKLPETPKTETPKVIKTEPLRKMHLSESLLEDCGEFQEDEYYGGRRYRNYEYEEKGFAVYIYRLSDLSSLYEYIDDNITFDEFKVKLAEGDEHIIEQLRDNLFSLATQWDEDDSFTTARKAYSYIKKADDKSDPILYWVIRNMGDEYAQYDEANIEDLLLKNKDKILNFKLNESLVEDVELTMEEVVKKIVDKFGKKKQEYRLVAKEYERWGSEPTYSKTFYAPNDYLALFSMILHAAPTISNFEDYMDADELLWYFENNPTYKDLYDTAYASWYGDGDDLILSLKNLTSGKTLYKLKHGREGYIEDEDEDDEYDFDESLNQKGKTKKLVQESYDSEISDVILVMYADGTEVDTFTNDREADAFEDELNSMSEDELSEKDILGYARLMRDDEDKFIEANHYAVGDEHEAKLNSEITYYINEFNGGIEESYESLSEAKKNTESAVYDELAKLWDGKDKLGKPKHIEVYSNPSANGYRIETANRSVIDEAEKIAKKYKLPYNSRQVRDYFVFTVDLPEEK